jgi:hypothetical protein
MSGLGASAGVDLRVDDSDQLFGRFWSKVRIGDGCWLWSAFVAPSGYGMFGLGSRRDGSARVHPAHRVAYALAVGPVPAGQVVAHRCDNRACVRPSHLFLGTQSENMRDMAAKGRSGALRGSDNPQSRLTERDVASIRRAARRGAVQRRLAERHGVSESTVSLIIKRRGWRHVEER